MSTLADVLRPEDAVVQRALEDAPDTELTRLAVDYLRSTHHASLLCFSLRWALHRARALYGPITDLLALIPHAPPPAPPHCDCAFDAFHLFDQMPNPFPSPAAGFQGMRRSFMGLKNHLDLRLLRARRRHLPHRHTIEEVGHLPRAGWCGWGWIMGGDSASREERMRAAEPTAGGAWRAREPAASGSTREAAP